jgi:hypothetical protein
VFDSGFSVQTGIFHGHDEKKKPRINYNFVAVSVHFGFEYRECTVLFPWNWYIGSKKKLLIITAG